MRAVLPALLALACWGGPIAAAFSQGYRPVQHLSPPPYAAQPSPVVPQVPIRPVAPQPDAPTPAHSAPTPQPGPVAAAPVSQPMAASAPLPQALATPGPSLVPIPAAAPAPAYPGPQAGVFVTSPVSSASIPTQPGSGYIPNQISTQPGAGYPAAQVGPVYDPAASMAGYGMAGAAGGVHYASGAHGCTTGCTTACCPPGYVLRPCCPTPCATPCCPPACGTCFTDACNHCCPSKCCGGICLHRSGVFGEYLYLQPRGIDMPYAVPQNGIGARGTVPVDEVGVLNYDYSSGIRFGGNLATDCYSSVSASFTWFETNTTDSTQADLQNVIQPLVMFPGTFNVGFTAQQATAGYSLDYQLADLDYRAVLVHGKGYHVNYLTGARYAHMDQDFEAIFPFAPPDGTTLVATEINFDGIGARLGLEGERRVFPCSGLFAYAKTSASLLGGEFRADYVQVNQFQGVEVFTGLDDDRLVTILELEVGTGWTNHKGTIRASAGYYVASWQNMITTPEFINAVQQVNFVDVSQDDKDHITFDGLVGRIEFRL